jgi:23S rRNA (uracil1939-C5)-methyltransferase
MARKKKHQRIPQGQFEADIHDLTHEGKGVANIDGKTVFIDECLPGEKIKFEYTAKRRDYDEGHCVEVLTSSKDRVDPACRHFDICGGCSLHHLDAEAQIRYKQDALISALRQIAHIHDPVVVAPLRGPSTGYRHKARLGVRYVRKKGRMLVGFRERNGRYLADLEKCVVLVPEVGEKLTFMAERMSQMEAREQIPQIEIGKGDDTTTLVVRNLVELSDEDRQILIDMARDMAVQICLQPKGPDSIVPLWPEEQHLSYSHPDFGVSVSFKPGDFIQVNPEINRQMVQQAIDWLDVQPEHKVLDLFCGLGNFTLPLATRAKEVVGVEGDQPMVSRARDNALSNGLENTRYYAENLMEPDPSAGWLKEDYDRILFDPPRSGAKEIIPLLAKKGVERIVYVSCHPGSLARDAGELVNTYGYRLEQVGVMDMFPHTAHVESMALFVKG